MPLTTILLVIIFICYIGLGVPDSLLGAAWPAIYVDFQVPVSSVNVVTVLISTGTIISSLLSAMLVKKLGTARITALCTTLTALALLGFSFSGNIYWMCLFALPLGFGGGSIDVALNNYVALHYKATHMSLLHCFYGVGVTLSPYLMSLALSGENDWRKGYRLVFAIQMTIALTAIVTQKVWKKVQSVEVEKQDEARILSIGQLIKMPAVRAIWGVFVGSCAIESICLVWGSTYLADGKGVSPYLAAKMITLYFVGVTLGRFLSGVIASRLSSWTIVYLGQGITVVAIISLFLRLPPLAAAVSLFFVGLGNGPVFPNMTHLTPICFGRDISQSVIGTQMAASYLGILGAPVLFGQIAQHIDIGLFAPFLLAMFCFMIAMTVQLRRRIHADD